MIGSLYSGISGLKANASAMSVIGDNIANVETTGFKSSRVQFANIFNATIGSSRMQIGRGVTMSGVSSNWSSGTIENTSNITDLAVNGPGMFIVRDSYTGEQFYTRAGQFEFNKDSQLVSPDGLLVQGYAVNQDGTSGVMGPITMPHGTSTPQATTEMSIGLNLNNSAEVDSVYSTTVTAYDSIGSAVEMNFTFTRTATGWDYYVTPSVGTATPDSTTPNSLTFTTDGELDPANCVPAITGTGPVIDIAGLSGDDLSITWKMLDDTGSSDGSVTGYSSTSIKTSQTQDGYPSGMLQSITVDEEGMFSALYSNGDLRPFAQIAMADFANYGGLAKQSNNLFTSTVASGQPVIATPNTAGIGGIAPSSLEMSNVDLATEFVDLITTQRAFQANSKVITTSDEILSELMNIKR